MTERIEAREAGLKRELSVRLLGMIGLGQSIGTGLFLGSGVSVQMAGPGVIISYLLGAGITLLVMWALAEMTVAHPMAGSFGAYAEHYLNPWAGWVTRYTYCMAQILAIGSQIVAVAIYCRYWFHSVPPWVWIAGFSFLLLMINTMNVRRFGEFEFWFSLIKVWAICLFILFGLALFSGVGVPRQGIGAFFNYGGFLPRGWSGVWVAVTMAIFSYYGLEAAAVSSGEAKDPGRTVPRALRRILGRLAFFYIASITILVGIMPWDQTGISESPFVKVYQRMGISGASEIMNFVVLTAALSSINSNLYVTSRMLFSLARSGQAPSLLGQLTRGGVPLNAILVSGVGLFAAAAIYVRYSDLAFVYLLGAALFGGIFCWIMIFVTHFGFRRQSRLEDGQPLSVRMPGYPYTTIIGLCSLLGVLITMGFVKELRAAWIAGVPWLLFLSVVYKLASKKGLTTNRGAR